MSWTGCGADIEACCRRAATRWQRRISNVPAYGANGLSRRPGLSSHPRARRRMSAVFAVDRLDVHGQPVRQEMEERLAGAPAGGLDLGGMRAEALQQIDMNELVVVKAGKADGRHEVLLIGEMPDADRAQPLDEQVDLVAGLAGLRRVIDPVHRVEDPLVLLVH